MNKRNREEKNVCLFILFLAFKKCWVLNLLAVALRYVLDSLLVSVLVLSLPISLQRKKKKKISRAIGETFNFRWSSRWLKIHFRDPFWRFASARPRYNYFIKKALHYSGAFRAFANGLGEKPPPLKPTCTQIHLGGVSINPQSTGKKTPLGTDDTWQDVA